MCAKLGRCAGHGSAPLAMDPRKFGHISHKPAARPHGRFYKKLGSNTQIWPRCAALAMDPRGAGRIRAALAMDPRRGGVVLAALAMARKPA